MVVRLNKPFLTLPDYLFVDISNINTFLIEHEIAKRNGKLDLNTFSQAQSSLELERHYCQFLPFLATDLDYLEKDMADDLISRLGNSRASSMEVSDENELKQHLSAIYQMTYANYVLGKILNTKGTFPRGCCGISSVNIVLSAIFLGYTNAVVAAHTKPKNSHEYLIFPFVLQGRNGVIIADPTSEQLWNRVPVRNDIRAIFTESPRWSYRTDGHEDYYPDRAVNMASFRRKLSYYVLREFCFQDIPWDSGSIKDVPKYLREAFANPVKMKVAALDILTS